MLPPLFMLPVLLEAGKTEARARGRSAAAGSLTPLTSLIVVILALALSGKDDDEDGDEDEFRNIVEAQATLAIREKQRRLNRLAEGRGGEVEVGEDDSSVSRAGAIVAVSVDGVRGGGRGEAALAGVERWGLYRQLFPKGWEEDEAKREDIGAALLSLKASSSRLTCYTSC